MVSLLHYTAWKLEWAYAVSGMFCSIQTFVFSLNWLEFYWKVNLDALRVIYRVGRSFGRSLIPPSACFTGVSCVYSTAQRSGWGIHRDSIWLMMRDDEIQNHDVTIRLVYSDLVFSWRNVKIHKLRWAARRDCRPCQGDWIMLGEKDELSSPWCRFGFEKIFIYHHE